MPRRGPGIVRNAESNLVFVDSSAWIALFSRRDQHHAEADRMFRAAVASKWRLLSTNLVLAEIHRLLLYRAGSRAAAAALESIDASPLVKIEFPGAYYHRAAKNWMEKLSDHAISYTDAVSFAVMESTRCLQVMTFDHHYRLAGFDVVA